MQAENYIYMIDSDLNINYDYVDKAIREAYAERNKDILWLNTHRIFQPRHRGNLPQKAKKTHSIMIYIFIYLCNKFSI